MATRAHTSGHHSRPVADSYTYSVACPLIVFAIGFANVRTTRLNILTEAILSLAELGTDGLLFQLFGERQYPPKGLYALLHKYKYLSRRYECRQKETLEDTPARTFGTKPIPDYPVQGETFLSPHCTINMAEGDEAGLTTQSRPSSTGHVVATTYQDHD